jgi:hypothetical protein
MSATLVRFLCSACGVVCETHPTGTDRSWTATFEGTCVVAGDERARAAPTCGDLSISPAHEVPSPRLLPSHPAAHRLASSSKNGR